MNIGKKIKHYVILAIIAAIFLYFFFNLFSYFSPYPWCKIQIRANIISGNRATIKKAIKLLRKSDVKTYRTLCRNVDTIYEKYCIKNDWHLNTDSWRADEEGCYIKGSKSIYISPRQETTAEIIRERALVIKDLAAKSQIYWLTKK